MIQVKDIYKSYGDTRLLDCISFNINSGEKIGLTGRNGHGKTTLLKILAGVEDPDSGSVLIPRNYTIGYVEQQLKFRENTVLKEAAEGLPEGHKSDLWMAEKLLSGLGFTDEDMEKDPGIFSGGYQVRIQLARILAGYPNLLLLDEPTNYLDIVSIRWLVRFLQEWKTEFILVTHDRSFMDSVTTHTMGIHRKKVRKISGGTAKLYEQIIKEEEIYEKTRVNDEKKRKEIELFVTRFRAKARLGGLVQSRVKLLEKNEKIEKLEKMKTLEFSFREAPSAARWVAESRNVSFTYIPGTPCIIDGFNITIGKKDRIGIVGKNGAGKSTLMRLLTGNLTPLEGEVVFHPRINPGYFGQTNIEQLYASRTVLEEIMLSHPDHDMQASRDICGSMLFEGDNALKQISVLSGGEKSRVLLGKLLVSPTDVLFLDEPTNHLDMESCDSLLSALDAYNGAVVIVTHNEMFLDALTERLIVFDDGSVRVHETGYRDFVDNIGWAEEKTIKGKDQAESGRKTDRRARADFVRERSKAFRPFEEKIEKIENDINVLEEEILNDNNRVIQASVEKKSGIIKDLSKKITEKRILLETLYEEWSELHDKYENEKKRFSGMT